MTSIDDIFKRPEFAQKNKRKLDNVQNPESIYKAAKTSVNGDVKGRDHSNGANTEDDEQEDTEAGPELPPDDPEDDEEGARFFGGGVTKDTAEVLDFIDEREQQDSAPEVIDKAWLRRLALNFERRISKNAELRAKFEDTPQKFMGSEGDLDADVKALSILTDHSELYIEFAKLGCINSLVSLLAHDNTDIAIDAIEVLGELTDEDVQADQTQWDALVGAMLDADLANLLIENFERLDENNESDRTGVYHTLSLLENLSSQANIAETIVETSSLLKWLLKRIQRKENPTTQNKQYASEILSILVQSSPKNRTALIKLDAVDLFLQILATYRKRDPTKDSEEEEYAEGIFDCLTCLVDDDEGKTKFLEAEGVELALIMLKEGKFSKPRALRLLDHAMGGVDVCEKAVEAGALKTLFSIFAKGTAETETLLGILASLLRLLPGSSAPRIRTLAKFVEKDYEKLNRLIKLRREYQSRLQLVETRIKQEASSLDKDEQMDMADEWLSRRLDAGLFSFQTIDVILAWLVAEDNGARECILKLLSDRDENLGDIKDTLQEQLEGAALEQKDMLETLISFLG